MLGRALTGSCVQAIEFILPDQQSAFVRELESHIMRCVKDSNGNHVNAVCVLVADTR
jgi:hypothetical protein